MRQATTRKKAPRKQATPPLLGVTVSTPKYAALAREAVRRVEKYLRIPVRVIECEESEGFMTKLKLDRLSPRTSCLFFDSDWWPVRDIDLSSYDGAAFMAVHDPGVFHPKAFPVHDCPLLGIAPDLYFNSGFFLWDNRNPRHREAFRIARRLENDIRRGRAEPVHDFGDQSLLNAGVQRAAVPVHLLPFSYNYMRFMIQGRSFLFTPAEVHAVHAAGFPLQEKKRHLTMAAGFLGYDLDQSEHGRTSQAAALAFQHARNFTLA